MGERYVTPCDLPTEHERELLTILIEECAEVQQRATKLLRFGAKETQPGQSQSNSERLGNEIGDLVCMVELCISRCIIDRRDITEGMIKKDMQLTKFTPPVRRDREAIALKLAEFDGNRFFEISDHDKEIYRKRADRILSLLPRYQGEML